jgi:hypothetical protein
LNVSVAPDVLDDHPPLTQDSPDEEPAMTAGGVFFAAKQGDPTVQNLSLQPMYTIEKRPRSLNPHIVNAALRVIELLARGPSTEFRSEEQVIDPIVRQGNFEIFDVEMWRVPGVRARTGVHQNLDPVYLQQADELLC